MTDLHQQILARLGELDEVLGESLGTVTALRMVVERHQPVPGLGGMVCLGCRYPWGDPVEAPCNETLFIALALGIETGDHRP